MAFVNELIPEVDKPSIGEIVSPMTQKPISLYKWTVDRYKNVFLIRTGRDRDTPENVYFLLSINI